MDSVNKTDLAIKNAYKNWGNKANQKAFRKWFGTVKKADGSIDTHDDENVKIRFKHAMDMMFEKTRRWSIMCCKSGKGACGSCGRRNVLAFVTKGWRARCRDCPKTYNSNSNIRMCPFSFTHSRAKFAQGWTMFHELVHIVSSVRD